MRKNSIVMFRGSEISVNNFDYRVAFDVATKQWGYVQHSPIERTILDSIWGWPKWSFRPIPEAVLNSSPLSEGQIIEVGPYKKIIIRDPRLLEINFIQLGQCTCEVCK